MAIGPWSRHSAAEKGLILTAVERARALGLKVSQALAILGLSSDRYYRWRKRQREGTLEDGKPRGRPQAPRPTPTEVERTVSCAREHPLLGYKRLAWFMANQRIVGLRPWQVLEILRVCGLLRHQPAATDEELKRPAAPTGPNQQWHVDLMYAWIAHRWYYLVDIIDAYSRYIVAWHLALTLKASEVTLTVQSALDQLPAALREHLRIVRDNGSQFQSKEWRRFISGARLTDIATRVQHPESNGLLERLHRTHRSEGPLGYEQPNYATAHELMAAHVDYYNNERPHSALHYLTPHDYHFGNPGRLLLEREQWLSDQLHARQRHWRQHELDCVGAYVVCKPDAPTESRADVVREAASLDSDQHPAMLSKAPTDGATVP